MDEVSKEEIIGLRNKVKKLEREIERIKVEIGMYGSKEVEGE